MNVTIFQRRPNGVYVVVPRGKSFDSLPPHAKRLVGCDYSEKLREFSPGDVLLGLNVAATIIDIQTYGFHIGEPQTVALAD